VIGCFLTQIDAGCAVLELRIRAPVTRERDVLRSKLVAALARRFAADAPGTQADQRPSFL